MFVLFKSCDVDTTKDFFKTVRKNPEILLLTYVN